MVQRKESQAAIMDECQNVCGAQGHSKIKIP